MDRDYAQGYRDLFETHWWWRARTQYVVEILDRYRPTAGWPTILDIGCGDGLFFDHLRQFGEVEGVEPCAELVSPDNPDRDRIHICPFDEHFKPAKQYSLILMLDVLEHLSDPVAALARVMDLLLPDGIFLATVPAFPLLWTNHDVLNHHFTRYTAHSFERIAAHVGLRIREQGYLFHWTFPLKLGVSVIERAFRLRPAPPTVAASWINEFLYRITRLEQIALGRLPIPFGSSLKVVGQRSR
ncbi:MAG: class I SAM-dependent methyltransferase [Acidobacteria bacterium]|nr:class I SAM-dependent methyltransferase [Acidobacteriota bacterium]